MSRKEARENIFKLIYERCINGQTNDQSLQDFLEGATGDDLQYIKGLYYGIDEKFDLLNSIIEKYSLDFKIERVYKIDLAMLMVALYEILFFKDIPYQVAINEAVEISKKYSTEKSYKFINGILSSIIKDKELILSEIGE